MGFLQGILAKIFTSLLEKLGAFLAKKAADWGFKKKVEDKTALQREAVLEARNIIKEKLKLKKQGIGNGPTEEDYERLKEANRRYNSGTFD